MTEVSIPELWIFNHYAGYPESVPATRTFNLARELTALGWRVTVIASSFNHYTFKNDRPEIHDAVHQEERDGVRWVFVKGASYRSNGAARLRNMVDYARRARSWARRQPSPSVVIGTTVHPLAAEAARRIAHQHNAVYCYEITDLWPETLVDLGGVTRKSAMYRLFRWLERRSLSQAAGVIGLLPLIPQYARESHGIELRRFCYLPNGMTPGRAPDFSRRVAGRVVYAGGFAPAHGMSTILETARLLGDTQPGRYEFFLYGDGPEREWIEGEAQRLGLRQVHFEGLVPKGELRSRLDRAEIALCTGEPMSVHRFGISFNKIFDYFDAALPVAYAVDGGNDPIAEAGAGISVPAGDASALADAVRQLSDLPADRRNELGRRGREFLGNEHAFEVLAGRLDQFLRSVLKPDQSDSPA